MSKQLYPKPPHPQKIKKSPVRVDPRRRPFHVEYTDPSGQLTPQWGFYNTELGVKLAAWYTCVFLGFRKAATLFDRDEVKPNG